MHLEKVRVHFAAVHSGANHWLLASLARAWAAAGQVGGGVKGRNEALGVGVGGGGGGGGG